jgi:DNA mismatch repair protein MutS2
VLSNRDHARLLQEPIVTQRNERHVVPVKAESKSQFPGIAHGASASGATVFIEPSAVVEPGNELAALSDRERAEIRRILRQLAEQVRQHRSELEGTSEAAAALDLAQAKGRLSEACNAAAPSISDGTELHLNDARHPLLVPRIAERAGAPERSIEPVPLSFRLDLHRRGLVLTGPNTGGKTVALKTAGLLSLMVQSGMHVPASSSSVFPVFRSIFADIGDDQSISASLSTFSAHLARVVEIDRELELPAMVILDEVGTGTDPSEGGALGCALVEHFLDRRAFVLASTHHGLLKAFAMTGEGVGAASFEFDPRSYEPTYQLVEGAAGRSLAFEIAERLGLPKSIVARARALQDERDRQVGELARRLENESERLDEERRRVERERKALDEERSLLERKDEQARETRSRELSAFRETLEEELRRTRHQLSELVEQATLAADELDSEARRRRKDLKDLEKTVAAKMEAVVAPLLVAAKKKDEAERPVAVSAETEAPLGPGTRVLVASFGMEGEIAALADDHADVLVRDKRLRLPLRELEALPHQSKKTAGARSHTSGGTSTPAARSVPVELNLIGCTVEEAIERADKFLDDALLADHQQVRLIHGHGTGRLRNALNGWLETHPQVERLDNENRGGVTVVELKG